MESNHDGVTVTGLGLSWQFREIFQSNFSIRKQRLHRASSSFWELMLFYYRKFIIYITSHIYAIEHFKEPLVFYIFIRNNSTTSTATQ